jgi:hypothetical protein
MVSFVVDKVGYEENINGNLPTNISALIDCLFVFLKKNHLKIPVTRRTGWYITWYCKCAKGRGLAVESGGGPECQRQLELHAAA